MSEESATNATIADPIEPQRTKLRASFRYALKKARQDGNTCSRSTQHQMLEICETEGEIIELLDFLLHDIEMAPQGVIGAIKCATERTRSFSLRSAFARERQKQAYNLGQPDRRHERDVDHRTEAAVFSPLFMAPAPQGA